MTSFDELIAQARPVTRTVPLCLRGDLIAERERAERELLAARAEDDRTNEPDQAPAIARRILELEEAQEAATVVVEVQALGRSSWERLLEAHPPTEEERAKELDYGAGYPAAVITACMRFPGPDGLEALELEQVERLLETLSERQFMDLWNAIMLANLGGADLPKSVAATATLRSSEPRSTTSPLEASRGDSL